MFVIIRCLLWLIVMSCFSCETGNIDYKFAISKLDSSTVNVKIWNSVDRDMYVIVDNNYKLNNYEVKYDFKDHDGWEILFVESFAQKKIKKIGNNELIDVDLKIPIVNIDTAYLEFCYYTDSVPSLENECKVNIQILPL